MINLHLLQMDGSFPKSIILHDNTLKMAKNKTSYSVQANGFTFSFTQDEIEALDIVQKSQNEFNLLHNQRSVNAIVLEESNTAKKLKVEVEGESFEVEIKEELDLVLEQMGFGVKADKHIKEIKAPMPGLVLEIAVAEGQEINEGDKILILVAMKMENIIKATKPATIKRVAVVAGQAVEKGQLLVELD